MLLRTLPRLLAALFQLQLQFRRFFHKDKSVLLLLGLFGSCLLQLILLGHLLIWLGPVPKPQTRDVFIYASFFYENSTSFSPVPRDSLAVLFLANRNDDFPWLRCSLHNTSSSSSSSSSSSPLSPAQLAQVDYVGICQLIIFVAWCNFPPGSLPARGPPNVRRAFVDLGTEVLADNALRAKYTRPILHKIYPRRADRIPRQLVMCISRIFAFEKWELLIAAMEVYKSLGVDLVVTHVYSALSPVFDLIRAYEAEGRLAIRKGVKLPLLPMMNFDPDREMEYSGQLAMAHECFYEFRASAQFISLVDWDDLLVTTGFPSLPAALHAAAREFPRAAYFYVNKLESGILRRAMENRSPSAFHVGRLLRNAVFTKRVYNSEKIVIRPSRVHAFWVHFTRQYSLGHRPAQLAVRYAMMLHLSRELNDTAGIGYRHNVLSALANSTRLADQAQRFFANRTVAEIMRSLPSRLHYFSAIRHCSLFINAYPDVVPPPPCLSYSLCPFPKIAVPCTVAHTQFHTTTIKPTKVYRVHSRQWSQFRRTQKGCF